MRDLAATVASTANRFGAASVAFALPALGGAREAHLIQLAVEGVTLGTYRFARYLTGEEEAVPTYIMLSTLTPEGIQTVKNNPQRIREVNREVEQLGAEVKAQWATLGSFDFVNIVEAPDEKTMARISLELGSRGTGHYETLMAIPIDDFIAAL